MDTSNMSSEDILAMQKKNCIFCKIIAKEIPSHEIYSDDRVVVILDINPANQGHCLILPRQHYQILPQIPPDLIGYMFQTAKKTSRSLLKAFGIQGTTVFVANGAVAGQKAPHFMIHVIPRHRGDMLFKMPKKSISEEEIKNIMNKLSLVQPKKIEEINQSFEQTKKYPEKSNESVESRIEEPEEKESLPESQTEHNSSAKEKIQEKNLKKVNIDDIANLFLN